MDYFDYFLLIAGAWLLINGLALWSFERAWRKAALVPVAIMALALAIAVLGVASGSNLAPIWVFLALPVCLGLTTLLWVAKGVAKALAG